jgi:alpha-galactosidase
LRKRILVFTTILIVGSWLFGSEGFAGRRPSPPGDGVLAAKPPMGWNSWDSYGRTLNEDTIKANAQWMARRLKQFGWEYVVIDEGWYLENPEANEDKTKPRFDIDSFGRFVPSQARFPSAGAGRTFKPLADYIHSLGLMFGIHIIRGIPREAVEKNLPIAGSSFHGAEAADRSDLCPWNKYNYGLDPEKPAAQAYYDSLANLYASWGVDFIKIDCICSHPYKPAEIRMFSQAITHVGRDMVLSLSPGPAPLEGRDELSELAQMWRISDDVWDVWYSDKDFPQGVKNQFTRAAKWAGVAKAGHWPDADMLPIGSLRPSAGWGEPRDSRLSHDEQRTMVSLWSMFRSPLIMGGNLLQADEWTTALLTNPEVIAIDQSSRENHPIISTDKVVIWFARPAGGPNGGRDVYIGVFNIGDQQEEIRYDWKDLGLKSGEYRVRDVWERRSTGRAASLQVTLRPHASILYRLSL